MTAFFNTGLTQQQFLDQYWQKKPLLIRQALPGFISPLSVDELAGLACEAEIESRLIREHGEDGPWQLQHGPFSEQDFSQLPLTHWTLLVQDVDKHVPALQSLWSFFRFIPLWRRDDLMISYAPQGGSVGPHTDGYDVFLLQAQGTRRWQIGDQPVTEAELLPDLNLKILAEFEPAQSWDLEVGDMLYLPPHFAHHGIAQNDCMTISVGFRAPTQSEVFEHLLATMLEVGLAETRYADADLKIGEHEAEIDATAVARVKQLLHQTIDDAGSLLVQSLGQLLTETKPSLSDWADGFVTDEVDVDTLTTQFSAGYSLTRNSYMRFAWHADEHAAQLFVAGECFDIEPECVALLPLLTESEQLQQAQWQQLSSHASMQAILCQLVEIGAWYWPEVNF